MFNVLIVDDDTYILEGLCHIVDWKSLGLQIVATASSGTAAIECLKTNTIHILLTDIKMPDMDGISLIKWVREHFLDIKCIILSGYDDYQYMKQAITLDIENYLIKSINENELLETLENTVKKLECKNDLVPSPNTILLQNILLRWMNDKITRMEFRDRISFLGLTIPLEYFTVCRVRFDTNTINKYTSESYSMYMNRILQVLSSASPAYSIYWVQDFDEDYCYLLSGESHEQIQQLTDMLIEQVTQIFHDSFFLTVGKNGSGFHSCPDSYQSSKYLMDYSLMLPYGSVVTFDSLSTATRRSDAAFSTTLDTFRHLLIENNREFATDLIHTIYHRPFNVMQYAPDYLKTVSFKIIFTLMETAQYLNLNSISLLSPIDLIYDKIPRFKSGEALYQWVKELVEGFFSLQKNPENTDNPMFQRIIRYVGLHYSEDISLKTLSYEFNTNTAYLGRIFKESAGESFSNYLNRIRIEKAKYILDSSNSTVQEISAKIGYNSTNYFVNVFKKYTGCFPSQFRSRNINVS